MSDCVSGRFLVACLIMRSSCFLSAARLARLGAAVRVADVASAPDVVDGSDAPPDAWGSSVSPVPGVGNCVGKRLLGGDQVVTEGLKLSPAFLAASVGETGLELLACFDVPDIPSAGGAVSWTPLASGEGVIASPLEGGVFVSSNCPASPPADGEFAIGSARENTRMAVVAPVTRTSNVTTANENRRLPTLLFRAGDSVWI